MQSMYGQAMDAAKGKKVIITETGGSEKEKISKELYHQKCMQCNILSIPRPGQSVQMWRYFTFPPSMNHGKLALKEKLEHIGACGIKMKTLSLVFNIFKFSGLYQIVIDS